MRNAPFRGTSRKASKKGGAKNGVGAKGGAPRYIRRTATSLSLSSLLVFLFVCAALPVVHALSASLGSCPRCSLAWWFIVWSSLLLWFSSPPVVQLLLRFSSWSCGATCSFEARAGGESGRRTGDADWRRSSASCVARPSVSVRGAPERELADHRGTSRVLNCDLSFSKSEAWASIWNETKIFSFISQELQ